MATGTGHANPAHHRTGCLHRVEHQRIFRQFRAEQRDPVGIQQDQIIGYPVAAILFRPDQKAQADAVKIAAFAVVARQVGGNFL